MESAFLAGTSLRWRLIALAWDQRRKWRCNMLLLARIATFGRCPYLARGFGKVTQSQLCLPVLRLSGISPHKTVVLASFPVVLGESRAVPWQSRSSVCMLFWSHAVLPTSHSADKRISHPTSQEADKQFRGGNA